MFQTLKVLEVARTECGQPAARHVQVDQAVVGLEAELRKPFQVVRLGQAELLKNIHRLHAITRLAYFNGNPCSKVCHIP